MRKVLLAVPLLAAALLLQLTVLNGLQLPGGGVPDLVLVLVAAVGLVAGPVPGMTFGFVAGLCVDLAPPGSPVIGQYTLAFCLAGWLCGRLQATAARSAVRALVLLAVVIAGAECFVAGLARALGQVTVSEARHVLPYTIVYDLLISPFVVYLVLVVSAWLDDGLVAGQPASGLVPGPNRLLARRARKNAQPAQPHQPQLRRAAARPHDGWVGTGPRPLPGLRAPSSAPRRLRPAGGVAGSASGYAYHASALSPSPVHLRLSGGRRGDGAVASAPGGPRLAGRHPGMLAVSGTRAFRPHRGMPGGSAAASYAPPASVRRPASPKFRGYRGDAGTTGALSAAGGNGARRTATPRLRLAGSSSMVASPVRPKSVPRLRFGSTPSPAVISARSAKTPKLDFRTRQRGVTRRRPAEPKFRAHLGARVPSAFATGAIAGGVLDQQAFRAIRRKAPQPRLKLGHARNSSGMLGGTGLPRASRNGHAAPRFRTRPAGRRSSGPSAKTPKFGYGRRSLLSFLVGKRVGGRWLARKRAGSRSAVWIVSRRPGGSA